MNGEENKVLGGDAMTDRQYQEDVLKTRIDELDRVLEHTTDKATIEYIEARKKELRTKLDTPSKL